MWKVFERRFDGDIATTNLLMEFYDREDADNFVEAMSQKYTLNCYFYAEHHYDGSESLEEDDEQFGIYPNLGE